MGDLTRLVDYYDGAGEQTLEHAVDQSHAKNITKVERGALLAIETTARPLMDSEPIPRHMMPAQNKFEAESAAEELKVVLGWHFNFRGLRINLPDNKFIAWSKDVREMINRGTTHAKEIKQNIGRFTHLGVVIPPVHHFMSPL